MIKAYIRANQHQDSLKMYSLMAENERIEPDKYTFTFVLKACTGLSSFEKGVKIHEEVVKRNLENDVFIGTRLTYMYSKMGDLVSAWKVFDKMPERDVIVWNALISGVAHCGKAVKAVELFKKMQIILACRRISEELIFQGRVTVNGSVCKTPQTKLDPARDVIYVNGNHLRKKLSLKIYLALNKPKGYICSSGEKETKSAMSLLDDFIKIPRYEKTAYNNVVKCRAIFLDYDGTVVPQPSFIKAPSVEVTTLLSSLSNDPKNTMYIVSERGRSSLSEWFIPCERLGIAAEHGYFIRFISYCLYKRVTMNSSNPGTNYHWSILSTTRSSIALEYEYRTGVVSTLKKAFVKKLKSESPTKEMELQLMREIAVEVLVNVVCIIEKGDETLLLGVYKEFCKDLHTDATGIGSLKIIGSMHLLLVGYVPFSSL
ncbi:putative alpha,alpha-trehalose-phosphate synthase [UDP-forming] 9 [Capsicum baccatum]|uniref:Alpha,alpha-trehalose-phosphate synthase [UDP-forming] 9 n=1 Tax=Capsicum baccatum TaxID=33114 RepID=A0A2G2V3P1_CAPBA|nr:putative alpha,alpha-trehalose-phosphate synthase [UDP-forming] 9 [Capsicum baccatum]